uniref:RING-type E3 ubiquitin transferase n=1 Tax=Brassica oleracea var. oleracea TaxID=109376 RepID=A0A0D3CYF3_BRAOL
MPPPPRNPDHRSPKRPRFPPPPPVPEEEEEEEEEDDDEFSDISADDEEDCSDESADDEEDDVEVVAVVTVAEAQSRRYVGSSSSTSSPVKLNSSEILDCPTCLEPLRGPIYQCVNGHITCSPCLPRVYKQCPVCRIPIGNIRCRAMEMVIESSAVPCRYAIYGCKETTLYGDQAHEKVCPYIRCQCPVTNCSYTGGYKEVEAHARLQHSWDVEHLIPFVFNTPQIFSINLARTSRAVFQEEKEGDMIVVQTFKRTNGGVCVTVSHIAPLSLGVRNLSCSLAKLNAYTTLRLGVMVKKIQKLREQEEPREDFLFIPDYMLSDNHLKMQICVGSEFKCTGLELGVTEQNSVPCRSAKHCCAEK